MDLVVDQAETERYYRCLHKIIGENGKSEGAQEHAPVESIFLKAEVLPGSKSSKGKKRKKEADSGVAEAASKDVETGENLKKKKKKKKQKKQQQKSTYRVNDEEGLQESPGDSNAKLQDADNTGKTVVEALVTQATGKTNKPRKQTDKQQKNLANGDDKHIDADRNAHPSQSTEDGDLIDPKKVYVGGIPYYSSEDDIRSFFGECGSISAVDCMTFPDSGNFMGIAFLTFKTEGAVQRALTLDGADMGGRFLKVQPCVSKPQENVKKNVYKEPPSKTEGYMTAYVGNLSWDITEEDLRGFFKGCNIDAIRFSMDKTTGEFRGFGHIDFADDESLELALKLDQQDVLGRPIKIAYAVPKKMEITKRQKENLSGGTRGKV